MVRCLVVMFYDPAVAIPDNGVNPGTSLTIFLLRDWVRPRAVLARDMFSTGIKAGGPPPWVASSLMVLVAEAAFAGGCDF